PMNPFRGSGIRAIGGRRTFLNADIEATLAQGFGTTIDEEVFPGASILAMLLQLGAYGLVVRGIFLQTAKLEIDALGIQSFVISIEFRAYQGDCGWRAISLGVLDIQAGD